MANLLLAPGRVKTRLALDPVYNNLTSLYLVALAQPGPRLEPWVARTADSLSDRQRWLHRLLFEVLYSAFEPDAAWPSFPVYVAHLAETPPLALRNRFLRHMFPGQGESWAARNGLMDRETFVNGIDRYEFDREVETALLVEAHALLDDLPALRETVVSHLDLMWHEFLASEWEHQQDRLQAVLTAYRGQNYTGLNAYEAIQAVTGRTAQGHWERVLAPAETLIFIPSPHIGPHLLNIAYGPLVRIVFSAHPLEGGEPPPAELVRADLLVQLRTLADDTRLRILQLLLDEGELYAQEIINRLKLTKSSASRHLSQLSASGYLVEVQQAGKAKSYRINSAQFREMMRFMQRLSEEGN